MAQILVGNGAYEAFNQGHAGHVIVMQNDHAVDTGTCTICSGTGKVCITSLTNYKLIPYENNLFDCLSHRWTRPVHNISWRQLDFTGHWDRDGCCQCSKSSN